MFLQCAVCIFIHTDLGGAKHPLSLSPRIIPDVCVKLLSGQNEMSLASLESETTPPLGPTQCPLLTASIPV